MNLTTIFLVVSIMHSLPTDLLSKVCFVESSHRPKVITVDSNGERSIGLCQIQLKTAQGLGFKGTEKDLLDPGINAQWAGTYLAYQYERYGNWVMAVKAYNAGSAKTNKPNEYYKRVSAVDVEKVTDIAARKVASLQLKRHRK